MIRFQPDTLQQALARFFDMAAPDANVYVEIAAPDLRPAAILLLAIAAFLAWRRLGAGRRATMAMLMLLLASSGIWLYTTGNGRYFLPLLLCAGPIAIGLLWLLPVSRALKGALAAGLIAAQLFVLSEQPPWHAWSWVDWTDGHYFPIQLGSEETDGLPTTYVTVSTISYSLIAPQFPASARWVNVATTGATPQDAARTDAVLRRGAADKRLRLLAPSLRPMTLADGRPTADIVDAFDKLIAPSKLRIAGDCHLIPSTGLARMEHAELGEGRRPMGFWSCPLAYGAGGAVTPQQPITPPANVQDAYARLGQLCPRFFPPEEKTTVRLPDGWSRHYSTETRVYVLDSGQVWYKFWRSLNPVQVGTIETLRSGEAKVDCSRIRGSDAAWQTGAQ